MESLLNRFVKSKFSNFCFFFQTTTIARETHKIGSASKKRHTISCRMSQAARRGLQEKHINISRSVDEMRKLYVHFWRSHLMSSRRRRRKKKLKFHQRNSNNKNKLQFPQPIKPRNPFSFISRFVFFFFSLFQPLVFFLGYRAIQCAAVVCSLREKRSRRNHKELVKKMTKTLNIETKCYNWILIRWRFFFCRTIFFFSSRVEWQKKMGKRKRAN